MTFSKGDIALYLIGGLALFTLLTAVVSEWLNHEPDEDPSEFNALWRDEP